MSAIGPNVCFVTDNVVSSARNLVEGFPLSPLNFSDLCELIEASILHERVIVAMPVTLQSPLEPLAKQRIISSLTPYGIATDVPAEQALLEAIVRSSFKALGDASVFGRGLIDRPESAQQSADFARTRLQIGNYMLAHEAGKLKVGRGAEKPFRKMLKVYGIYLKYADAVFDAAQACHVHAYASSSEVTYAIRRTVQSTPRALYDRFRALHKERVDAVLADAGFKSYSIPPFASIVLSRCRSRDDIVPQIISAREEFAKFRETCTSHALRIRAAVRDGTHQDVIELQNDLDRAMKVLTEKTRTSHKDRRFTYQVWNVLKELSPWSMTKKVLDQLVTYDIEKQHLQTVNGLMDIWKKLGKASSYERVLRSDLFRSEYAPAEFASFADYLAQVRELYPVPRK